MEFLLLTITPFHSESDVMCTVRCWTLIQITHVTRWVLCLLIPIATTGRYSRMGTRKQMECVLIFLSSFQKCTFHSSCLSSSAARLYFCVSRDLFGCILSTQSFPLPTETECLRQTSSSKADRPAQTAGSGWLSGGGGGGAVFCYCGQTLFNTSRLLNVKPRL